MRPRSSPRGALLIAIVSPALLGFVKCVFVSNPTVATARIERIEPLAPRAGDIVQFSGTGTGTPPLLFTWDFGDGTTLGEGTQAAHVYLAAQSYRVTFTVRDSNGDSARDTAQVSVSPGIPSPKLPSSTQALVLVSPAFAGLPVQFTAMPLAGDAGAVNYIWTFSDGQSVMGQQVAATFPVAGIYFASLAATDDMGAITYAQVSFKVRR